MKNKFFENLLSGNKLSPSQKIKKNLLNHFNDAINIEWTKKEKNFEAIFYCQNLEYIAQFSASGDLLEYKINLPSQKLPQNIINQINNEGEIMNSVVIHSSSKTLYEVIVRNRELVRFVLVVNDEGSILERRFL